MASANAASSSGPFGISVASNANGPRQTRTTFRNGVLRAHVMDARALAAKGSVISRPASFRINLSSVRSDIAFLSRAFSRCGIGRRDELWRDLTGSAKCSIIERGQILLHGVVCGRKIARSVPF